MGSQFFRWDGEESAARKKGTTRKEGVMHARGRERSKEGGGKKGCTLSQNNLLHSQKSVRKESRWREWFGRGSSESKKLAG